MYHFLCVVLVGDLFVGAGFRTMPEKRLLARDRIIEVLTLLGLCNARVCECLGYSNLLWKGVPRNSHERFRGCIVFWAIACLLNYRFRETCDCSMGGTTKNLAGTMLHHEDEE